MGVLPLQFAEGESVESLGLTGEEAFSISGLADVSEKTGTIKVEAGDKEFDAVVRIDTPGEAEYYRHGGILPYVLRSLQLDGDALVTARDRRACRPEPQPTDLHDLAQEIGPRGRRSPARGRRDPRARRGR